MIVLTQFQLHSALLNGNPKAQKTVNNNTPKFQPFCQQ